MPIILRVVVRTGKRSNAPYIGAYFIVISNSKYYIYANNMS